MSSTTNNTVYTTSSLITLLPSEPSICIPRVFMNIQKERIYDVFADLFGRNAIERVDMIERKNDAGEEYKRAFVHFKSWPRTEQATEVRLKLLNGVQVKIMYDQPWFWLISASRVPRPEDVTRREHRDETRPFIVIDEDTANSKDTHRTPYQPRQKQQQYRDERRPQQHQQHHQERQYQPQPRHQERFDARPSRREERYEPREQQHHDSRDFERYDERRDYPRTHQHRPHPRQERYEERSSYARRIDSHRPPSVHITPTKSAPEIAHWIEKSKKAPGAPVKSQAPKKPRLVIDDEDDDRKGGRKLSFDKTSADEAVPSVPSAPSTPPVPPQQQPATKDN